MPLCCDAHRLPPPAWRRALLRRAPTHAGAAAAPTQVRPEAVQKLVDTARQLSSEFAPDVAPVVKEQSCHLPCAPDGLPVIGALPGAAGAYVATGHSCWGILNAPATGLAVAELIADGKARCVDLRPFDPARFGR